MIQIYFLALLIFVLPLGVQNKDRCSCQPYCESNQKAYGSHPLDIAKFGIWSACKNFGEVRCCHVQANVRKSDCKCVDIGTCGSRIPCGLPDSELCCEEEFECVIPSECQRTFVEQFGYESDCDSPEEIRCFLLETDPGIFINEQGVLVISGGVPYINPLDTGATLNTEFRDYLGADDNLPLSMIIEFGNLSSFSVSVTKSSLIDFLKNVQIENV